MDEALGQNIDHLSSFQEGSKETIEDLPSTSKAELVESKEELLEENDAFSAKFLCNLCENERFQNEKRSPNSIRFLRPCLCDIKTHHGCMVDYLQFHRKCPICEVEYRYYKYGSGWHFFKRYWYQFLAISLLSIFLILVGTYLAVVGFPSDSFGSFFFLVLGTISFILGSVIFFKFYLFMFGKRFPRFQKRYGNTTVFAYKPNLLKKKKMFKSLP